MTRYMFIATLAWLFLVAGYACKRRPHRHIPLVLTGIFLDIALVVFLQVSRHAVQTALAFELSLLKQLHIAASTTALVLYFPVIFFGWRLFRDPGSRSTRILHRRLALTTLTARTLGFLLMFSMWH